MTARLPRWRRVRRWLQVLRWLDQETGKVAYGTYQYFRLTVERLRLQHESAAQCHAEPQAVAPHQLPTAAAFDYGARQG